MEQTNDLAFSLAYKSTMIGRLHYKVEALLQLIERESIAKLA